MNLIFLIIFAISVAMLIFINPDQVLGAMLSGGQKALDLCLRLAVVYVIWLGVFEILRQTGVTEKFAKKLKPVNRLIFGELTEKENEYISLNISANMLGMSGATTPMGIKAIAELEKRKGTDKIINTFFVVNAVSIQLIPTSVIALRTTFDSVNAGSIILPTVISTFIGAVVGIILIRVFK